MTQVIKCTQCIEEFLQLPADHPDRVTGEAWLKVREADTYVPSWQTTIPAPGQMVVACVTVPVCIQHLQIKQPTPQQIAARSGLAIPGVN
jgi:hypothetical protein